MNAGRPEERPAGDGLTGPAAGGLVRLGLPLAVELERLARHAPPEHAAELRRIAAECEA